MRDRTGTTQVSGTGEVPTPSCCQFPKARAAFLHLAHEENNNNNKCSVSGSVTFLLEKKCIIDNRQW